MYVCWCFLSTTVGGKYVQWHCSWEIERYAKQLDRCPQEYMRWLLGKVTSGTGRIDARNARGVGWNLSFLGNAQQSQLELLPDGTKTTLSLSNGGTFPSSHSENMGPLQEGILKIISNITFKPKILQNNEKQQSPKTFCRHRLQYFPPKCADIRVLQSLQFRVSFPNFYVP